MTPQKPREIAGRILGRHASTHGWIEDLLREALDRSHLMARDRALVHELVCGVVRWQATLDWLIDQKTGGRRQKPGLQVLLRLGLYQLFWLDRVPDHAAVNETVALARAQGFGPEAGFVNALLRGCARERDATRRQLDEMKRTLPALGWSHPAWLIERWQARWGIETTEALLAWNNAAAPAYARVNTLKTQAGKLLERWRDEGVEYDFGRWDWVPENLVFPLKSHPPLGSLGSFRDGWFYVQDPSTILAVSALGPEPGHAVLDLCAAPGGKSTYIAQCLENASPLVARDTSAARLEVLRSNCARLGATCVRVEAGDPAPATRFDRVLVDAPCSNTGVMRRRVDVRWRIRPDELERLQATQLSLLGQAVGRLEPDGRLVYSTCSLESEENQAVTQRFLAEHPTFQLRAERELLPFRERVDGAYVAVFERRA